MYRAKSRKSSPAQSIKLFNRELSWLEFNGRVLEEAKDASIPLLERLQFLSITASNLDEFFMVRVGGVQMLLEEGVSRKNGFGIPPEELLPQILHRVREMVAEQYICYREQLEPELQQAGIRRIMPGTLTTWQYEFLQQYFQKAILPVLSPVGLGPGRPFPLLLNLGLNLAVRVKGRRAPRKERFVLIPLGSRLDRFIFIPEKQGTSYILLEDVLVHFLEEYFPEERVVEAALFRITRNADLSVDEDDAEDFLEQMESVLRSRKSGNCVRLEMNDSASPVLHRLLCRHLKVREEQVFRIEGPLDLSAFRRLAQLPGYDRLHHAPWPPQAIAGMDPRKTIFEEISRRNLLLFHPFQSIDPVIRLLEEAAEDPSVLAIKQILYRTSAESPIVAALQKAAEQGKHITVIVELKARFDEARNIVWARRLEEAGVQVIYGIKGLKTHAKICIVVRREPQGIVRYIHFGTGNYNEKTARQYSDVGYMTCDPTLGADATAFFNAVSGYSVPVGFQKLEAAPTGLRQKILDLIASETQRKKSGQDSRIMAKMNSLEDTEIIQALYQASQAGVPVFLNIRGLCCLCPGVKGLSENITVVSIIDRFLEHSRIFYFYQGGEEKIFISSADWMPRNLDRRIELLVPIEDLSARTALTEVLGTYFEDNRNAWQLQKSGVYTRLRPTKQRPSVRSQENLYLRFKEEARLARQPKRTVFEPHRAPEKEL
jgi:polyphosphate kinase